MGKLCSLVIGGGSIVNVVSLKLVKKLAIPTLAHPKPYKLQELSEKGEMLMDRQVSFTITLGSYRDEILFQVVPMEATHIILCKPWQFDRRMTYDKVILKP
ncbi:hypothetical protein CR513_16944, partial [Mucuna pruriens]